MDYIKNIDSNRYIISLDSLDLALLPNMCSSMLKTETLWTVNHSNLNNNNYFGFEIIPKPESTIHNGTDSSISSVSDSVSDNNSHQNLTNKSRSMPTELTAKTTCHLCDIEIPKAYIAEHENSLKHKAHLKLADVILNRTRKHMLQKTPEHVQKNNNTYFCGPCASEIQLVNKANHDKSKAHKQSASLDRILYELVALYTDEDHTLEESDELADKTFDTTEGQETEVNYNNTVVISDIRARLEEFEIKNYIKMIDECDGGKPYALSGAGSDVRIAMENGCEIIVAESNFNGFVRIDDSFTKCVICKTVFDSEQAHKITDTHIKNVCTPFKDLHCLRNLDNSSVHCVICNKIVNNASLHISCDETHNELLQKAIVVKEKPVEPPKDILVNKNESYKNSATDNTVYKENETNKNNETISTIYNGFGDESNHDGISKDTEWNRVFKSPRVTDNKMAVETVPAANVASSNVTVPVLNGIQKDDNTFHCYPCNLIIHVNNITSHMNGNKHINNSKSKYHYIMKPDVGSSVLICRVCNLYVGIDANDVKEHVTTNDHIKRYNELLSINCIDKKKNSFYCKPCDLVIPKRNELYHIEKLNHEAMLEQFIEAETRAVEPDKVEEAVGKENNVKEIVTDDSKSPDKILAYYCAVCNVYVPNNPNNISDHNNGARHRKNAPNIEFEVAVESNSLAADDLDEFYQMDATGNEKTRMCKVCQVVIPNMDTSITEHILGRKHEALLHDIEDANNLELNGDKYYCKDCKLYVKTQNLFKHINETQHKAKQRNLDQKTEITQAINTSNNEAVPSTSKDAQNSNITEDPNTGSINNLYLKFKHHFRELEDKQLLQCKVCFDIDIPNTAASVASHTATESHMRDYEILMTENYIFKTEEPTFFCGVCVCLVPLKGEVHHAKGLRHTGNYSKALNPEHVVEILKSQTLLHYCEFCKTLMNNDKAKEHSSRCHKCVVQDKICFCTSCDPYLPGKQ